MTYCNLLASHYIHTVNINYAYTALLEKLFVGYTAVPVKVRHLHVT